VWRFCVIRWLLAPSSCRGFLAGGCFSAAIKQVAATTIQIEPQVCVRAARGLGDILWPGDGRNENKKPPKQRTLRPRSFPVVLCESNHCFEGKRTVPRSFLGCNVVRKKFPRNHATCANANIAVLGREDVEESVATWNSGAGSKVQREKNPLFHKILAAF
jgi:hypothetical protein